MSFAKAMQPTPRASQITVASSVYSTDETQAWLEDAPPVPRLPKVYLQSAPQASKATFASSVYSRNVDDEWPVPPVPRVDAPDYAEDAYEDRETDRSTPTNPEQKAEIDTGLHYDGIRQKRFDKALALLEGRSASPWTSASSIVETSNEEPEVPSRRSKRFENWVKRQAEMEQERDRQHEHEQAGLGADADFIVGNDEQQALLPPKIPSNRYTELLEQSHQVSKPAPAPRRTAPFTKKLKPVTATERAQHPHKYYPYVCDPATVKTAERTVKAFAKQAKDAIVGPPKSTPYDKLMASMTPQMKMAFTCNGMFPSPEELFKPEPEEWTAEISAPKLQRQISTAKEVAKREAVPPSRAKEEQKPLKTKAEQKQEQKEVAKKEKEDAKRRKPITIREAKHLMPLTLNGSRLGPDEDRRRPLAPQLPIEEAQAKFVGHVDRHHPRFPPVRRMPAARETVWGDFCKIGKGEWAFEELFPEAAKGETVDESSSSCAALEGREREGVEKRRQQKVIEAQPSSATLAAEYQSAISSPVGFEEIKHGEFPIDRRVLYDPDLSSGVPMPEFSDQQLPPDPNPEADPKDFAHRLSKALREERQKRYRERDASQQDLSAPLDGVGERKQRWTREGNGYLESCDM